MSDANTLTRTHGKPILCLDFDGVINPYSRGWQNGVLYEDDVVPGFFEWAEQATKLFRVTIYSSRSKTEDGKHDMRLWMVGRAIEAGFNPTVTDTGALRLLNARTANLILLDFAHEKPPAFLTIDDRAVQFRGDWTAWWLRPERLLAFKPWTSGEQVVCGEPSKTTVPVVPTDAMILAGTKAALDQLCYKSNAWDRDATSDIYKDDLLKAMRFGWQAMLEAFVEKKETT